MSSGLRTYYIQVGPDLKSGESQQGRIEFFTPLRNLMSEDDR